MVGGKRADDTLQDVRRRYDRVTMAAPRHEFHLIPDWKGIWELCLVKVIYLLMK